jgi:predicted metallopeptidase
MLNEKQITLMAVDREINVEENSWDRVYIFKGSACADIYAIVSVFGEQAGYSPERVKELQYELSNGYGYEYKS